MVKVRHIQALQHWHRFVAELARELHCEALDTEVLRAVRKLKRKADLIHVCEICNVVFYADRIDQLTCGEKCAATRRMRRWRLRKEMEGSV